MPMTISDIVVVVMMAVASVIDVVRDPPFGAVTTVYLFHGQRAHLKEGNVIILEAIVLMECCREI